MASSKHHLPEDNSPTLPLHQQFGMLVHSYTALGAEFLAWSSCRECDDVSDMLIAFRDRNYVIDASSVQKEGNEWLE